MDNLSGKTFLLYGLGEDRETLFVSLKKGKIKRDDVIISEEAEIGNYTIDVYNNTLVHFLKKYAKYAETNEFWNLFLNGWSKLLPEELPNLPLWKEFCSQVKTNPKNRLEKIYQGTTLVEIYGNPECPNVALDRNNERFYFFDLHVMRGCKIGIDIARKKPNVSIYFSIDRLDIPSVFNKKLFKRVRNTTNSELRYVYRHWQELKDKVHFFKGEEEIPAPWVAGEHQKAWESYQPKSWHEIKKNLQVHQINNKLVVKDQEQLVQRSQIRSQLPLHEYVNRAKATSETGIATASDRRSNTKVHNGKERL
ncbi:hypothetical protein E1H99_07550 [Enterococcus hirae]|nr:hypothetical protein E1H99_07550 [Enterococcus hirae]